RYSKYLESLAYYWTGANDSKLPDRKNYAHNREIGMNIAFSTGRKPSLAESICPWVKEAQYYIYANNTCRHTCGEYKQMISSHTSEVGCAMGERNDVVPGWPNPQYVTVCVYRPRGNFGTTKPYRSAPSCYYCRMDEYCYRNQCVRNPQFNHVYPTNNLPKPEDREVPQCAVV
ncbi:GLIPR1-like protein 1, partial [Taenia solium]